LTHPEPHLITPLAYLGYHDRVGSAPYDHINSAEAIRQFVNGLPHGEADYLDALRAYTDAMYGRMLGASDKSRFVDKTPAYALVLPFLTKLYPEAKYIVLTRHPLAVFSSYANSFFEGDWAEAHRYNPIVERYVPAIAALLDKRPVPVLHVRYEDLVEDPERHMARVFSFVGLDNEPEAVDYGDRFEGEKKGAGDPIGVGQHKRPNAKSVDKWAAELVADEDKLALGLSMLAKLSDEELSAWGNPKETLLTPLAEAGKVPPKRAKNEYTMQRRVLLALRKNIHQRPHGKLVERVRYYCDVLLRDTL
jgi:hypothetical protein